MRAGSILGLFALLALGCGARDAGDDTEAAPCVDGDERRERHGTDCACCHVDEFGVAGSIADDARPIAKVIVRDAAGLELVMTPNPYGNFFRHSRVVPPLVAGVVDTDGRARWMSVPAPNGSCNGCHREGGEPGPIGSP